MDLKVVPPDSDAAPEFRGPAYEYDELAKAYNDNPVGTTILTALKGRGVRVSNVVQALQLRGLAANASVRPDARVFRAQTDENGVKLPTDERPLAVKKLTNKKAQVLR